MDSVRLGALDEIDGPAFLDGEGETLAARLSVSLTTVVKIKAALRQAEEAASKTRAGSPSPALRRPLELGWGWAGAREASSGSSRLQQPELTADRIAGALWGIFIGDALAMPAHWYYDVEALQEDYGTITGYVAPRVNHATNYIMADHWKQNKHRVRELVGKVIHKGNGPYGPTGLRTADIVRNWEIPNRHYHAGMAAGENTFNAHTARVLIRSIIHANGQYDRDGFIRKPAFSAIAHCHYSGLLALHCERHWQSA